MAGEHDNGTGVEVGVGVGVSVGVEVDARVTLTCAVSDISEKPSARTYPVLVIVVVPIGNWSAPLTNALKVIVRVDPDGMDPTFMPVPMIPSGRFDPPGI